MLQDFNQLRATWEQRQSRRATGGLLAISGFEYQFLLTLLKIVRDWKRLPEIERHNLQLSQRILPEALSDIVEIGVSLTLFQVKRTLSEDALPKALEELWEIFKLTSESQPNLLENLRFVISGKFQGQRSAEAIIQGWGTKTKDLPKSELAKFKSKVSCELVADPRTDLKNELETLSRDEDAETTVSRWLGYLLQLGSGVTPERISSFIWRELCNDQGLVAFSATLARVLNRSQQNLHALRGTLGKSITLARTELSELQAHVSSQPITLLCGPSGSGKSVLCKLAIQQYFQNFDCLFLTPADVVTFTKAPDMVAGRELRRLDELFTARIIENPILIIDDLSDADEQSLRTVLDLIHTSLNSNTNINIHFVLVSHPSGESRIREKLSTRFGQDLSLPVIDLPQIPIQTLNSTENLPVSITELIQRHDQFGPALNLKLLDWLTRSVQDQQVDVSKFKSDIDLLNWFWHNHVGGDRNLSELRALVRIAEELANKFTPDLPLYFDSSIDSNFLWDLIRKDCLRIIDERVTVSHRFVGDCARFYSLTSNRREIETTDLVEKLTNPLWSQPVRWFALQSVMESEHHEFWDETLCDALEKSHLQLVDSFLDGAILSKQPGVVLGKCRHEHLPMIIERLIIRLMAIATTPIGYMSESTPLWTKISLQEQVTGNPKPQLWEPVWIWLLSQNPDNILDKSCIIFKAAQAWLNWSADAIKFPFRAEIAEFIFDLVQRVLLPDPEPPGRIISGQELIEIIKLRQQLRQKGDALPTPELSRKNSYYLGEFKSSAFACVVFALRIIPERSTWLLKTLAGRAIITANRLEPTQTSQSFSRPGVGVLDTPHPKGPVGKVNNDFRKFMLKRNGFYLTTVILVDFQLGAELLLALTIQPPHHRYENDWDDDWNDRDLGTEGSHDLDACTFDFEPLLTLLQIDEKVAIEIIDTLCQVVTQRNRKVCENLYPPTAQSDENLATDRLLNHLRPDAHDLTLTINGTNKQFKGERKALYWHRNWPLSPKILNCLLMTLEAWLYSRPTRTQLERSITVILERSNSVAMLGVLVTLAKCDPPLLTGILLPLVSSLQLLIWLEFEPIDRGQNHGFDHGSVYRCSATDIEKLHEFQRLPYREVDLQQLILTLWVNGMISADVRLQVLENWDSYQLSRISEANVIRAAKIRTWFECSNWQEKEGCDGNPFLEFVGELSTVVNEDDSALWKIKHLQLTMTCREIIDGKQEKTLELHESLVSFVTNEEQIAFLQQKLEQNIFTDIVWATITIILAPPHQKLMRELKNILEILKQTLVEVAFAVDNFSRCQRYGLDAHAFIAHVAPELIKRLSTSREIRVAAFRRLIGSRNEDTSEFMRSWLKTYGIKHPLTQALINIAPRIARLIVLTYALAHRRYIKKATGADGTHFAPRAEDIAAEICHSQDPQTEGAWLNLQNDFSENTVNPVSIIDEFEWIPDVLKSSIQEIPSGLLSRCEESLDLEFLGAVLIPILQIETQDDEDEQYLIDLSKQIITALVRDRENLFLERQRAAGSHYHNYGLTHLDETQYRLLGAAINPEHKYFITQVGYFISTLKSFQLVECHMLCSILDVLIYRFTHGTILKEINRELNCETSHIIGVYLFAIRNQSMSELRILGGISEVWEKLVELLSRNLEQVNSIVCADQSLVHFLQCFQEAALSYHQVRQQLYAFGRINHYKQLRRTLLEVLAEHSDLLPKRRDKESKLLVQLLAEFWDCDRTWITKKQTRLQNLRTLLGQLRQADAEGSGTLADHIAQDLAGN